MHEIESVHPSIDLRKYVRAYAQRKTDIRGAPAIARVPARLEQVLEFQFGDAFDVLFDSGLRITTPQIAVIGPQTHLRASVSFCGRIESFGVFFQPSGFSQIFGVPMRSLTNVGFDGTSILGQRIRSIWNELGETEELQNRVGIIERFLRQIIARKPSFDRMMATTNRILSLQGQTCVAELAHQERMGIRQFERKFMEQVGTPPKVYARIARFQTALDMKLAFVQMTWLDISHALGYYDQMHLIHDFKSLGGGSPSRVLEHLIDMRPDAVTSSFGSEEKSSRVFTMHCAK